MDTNTNTDTNANTNTNTKFRLLNLYVHNTWPTEKMHGNHVGPVKMGAQKATGKYEVSQFPQSLLLADLKSQLANLTNERLTMQDIWIFSRFPCACFSSSNFCTSNKYQVWRCLCKTVMQPIKGSMQKTRSPIGLKTTYVFSQ